MKRGPVLLLCGLAFSAGLGLGILVATASPHPNVPLSTLGGAQVWTDEFFQANWRIQKNVLTGHHRLLDPKNIRRAWGTYEQCRAAFSPFAADARWKNGGRRLVVLVHGLGRSAGMFDDLATTLQADGYDTAAITYASTRESVEAHADHLARLIAGLEGVQEVSFVTHSMGGLVVRALLADPRLRNAGIRFGGLVMIAPPNRGSAIARTLKDVSVYRWLTTETGRDLTPAGARALPTPAIDFAIVAGGLGDGEGFNPFLDGDDDGVVTVAETRLAGARDFRVVPSLHGLVDNHPETVRAVRAFLKNGKFD